MMSRLKDFRQEVFNKSADGSYWKQSGERDVWRGSERRQGDRRGWKEKKNLEVIWMEESTNWKLEKRKRKEWRLTYQFDCLYVPWTAREPDQRLGLRGGLWSLCFLWVWKMQEVLSINKHPKWTLFLKGSWIFRCAVHWHMGGAWLQIWTWILPKETKMNKKRVKEGACRIPILKGWWMYQNNGGQC